MEERGDQFGCFRILLLLVLIVYGFQKKWWKHLEESPLIRHSQFLDYESLARSGEEAVVAVEGAHGAAAAGAEEAAAEENKEEEQEVPVLSKSKAQKIMKDLRSDTPSLMKFIAGSLAKPLNQRLYPMVIKLPREIKAAFYDEMDMLKAGTKGTFDLHEGFTAGSQIDTMAKHWDWVTSTEFAQSLGFMREDWGSKTEVADATVSKRVWLWTLSMFGSLCRLHCIHACTPPMMFVPLGGRNKLLITTVLRRASVIFGAKCQFETHIHGIPKVGMLFMPSNVDSTNASEWQKSNLSYQTRH